MMARGLLNEEATMSALAQMMIVSKNRLEGSLGDVPLADLLAACHKHLVTGAIKVWNDSGKNGVLLLRAGYVDQARFDNKMGDPALDDMMALREGGYEIAQQLPDLAGKMGKGSALEGNTESVGLVPIMRHCEQNALSCIITVINDFDRGEIHYKAGELSKITMNGTTDDDAIVTMLEWKSARYRVSAPPLSSDMPGWPKVGREATVPFKIGQDHLAPVNAKKPTPVPAVETRPVARGTSKNEALPASKSEPAAKAETSLVAQPLEAKPRRLATSKEEARTEMGLGKTLTQAFLITLLAGLAFALVAFLTARG
jgi:hypothetical protein